MIAILNDITEREYVSLFSIRNRLRRLTMKKKNNNLPDGAIDLR